MFDISINECNFKYILDHNLHSKRFKHTLLPEFLLIKNN